MKHSIALYKRNTVVSTDSITKMLTLTIFYPCFFNDGGDRTSKLTVLHLLSQINACISPQRALCMTCPHTHDQRFDLLYGNFPRIRPLL